MMGGCCDWETGQDVDDIIGEEVYEDDMEPLSGLCDVSEESLDKTFAKKGFAGKLKPIMFLQLGFAIYYIVVFSFTLVSTNGYYIWPELEPDEGPSPLMMGRAPGIRSEEPSFECNGYQYYLECQGPKYLDDNTYNDLDYCSSESSLPSQAILVLIYTVIFATILLASIGFCFHRLYYGLYNQLNGLVKFKSVKDANTGIIKSIEPVKFAVAFTLFCNYARSGIAVFQNDVCGRLAFFGNSDNYVAAVFASIYLICFVIYFFATWEYLANIITCGRSGQMSQSLWEMLFRCKPQLSKQGKFFLGRVILCIASISILGFRLITSITNFSINFDFSFPNWAIMSSISLFDLVASFAADVVLLFHGGAYDLTKGCFASHCASDTRSSENDLENNRSSRQRAPSKRYDCIPPGTNVSLQGLVALPERNGDMGVIQQYNPESGRYVVQLEDTDETMSVKASNLLQHVDVRINGIASKPELNGMTGTIMAWKPRTERYNIKVMALEKVVSLKPTNVILDNGTVGSITGLITKPELNGEWGTIKEWIRDTNKYDVQLSADKIIRIKAENIRV